MKYIAREIIEAEQWNGSHPMVHAYTGELCRCKRPNHEHGWLRTPGMKILVCPKDWIVTYPDGHMEVMSDIYFRATYMEYSE